MSQIETDGSLKAHEIADALAGRAGRGASRLAQAAWVVTDAARAPYSSLITLFVFSAYFTTTVMGDPVRGQATWSFIVSAAALILAIGAPVLGPIADAGGRIKPWLGTFIGLGLPCIASLWFATPAMTGPGLYWIMAALVGAKISIEYSNVFVNALLPRIAARDKVGMLSGLGLAGSNVTNLIVLLFFLFAWSWNAHPLFGLDPALHEPQRAAGPLTALWFGLFSLPLFFFTPDAPASSLTPIQAVRAGLVSLAGSARKAREHPHAALFLLARMVYNEGFIVMMLFNGIFAAGVLKWTPTMIVLLGLINCAGAILAGLTAGLLDRRIGSKATTIIFILVGLAANITLCSITPHGVFFVVDLSVAGDGGAFPRAADKIFVAVSTLMAIGVTGGFASSRALLAKLAPPTMLADFFSLYSLSGTATSFVGPLAIGVVTSIFHNQRAGVSVGVVFFVVGLLLLLPVREEGHGRAARAPSAP